MKRSLLIVTLLLTGATLQAQPWMPKGAQPVKLQDIIDAYGKQPVKPEHESIDNDKIVREDNDGDNYQFERWAWYWKHHVDKDGYLMTPIQNVRAWNTYLRSVAAEKSGAKTTATADWSFQGPSTTTSGYHGIGRINHVAFHPTDSNTFIVGSAGGGAWRTTDGGATWTTIYGSLPTLGVSHINYNPLNPNVIYLCTGDADDGNNFSMGVMRSNDGGTTWDSTGLSWSASWYYSARWLDINPFDTASLVFAANAGIYKSPDGGTTWTNTFGGDMRQVMYKPGDSSIVYATGYKYSDTSAQIFRSTDGGVTWTAVTAFTDAQRIAIAVTAGSPDIVEAVVSNNNSGLLGIFKSTNSGASFTNTYTPAACTGNILSGDLTPDSGSCGGQGWYDLCIAINPTDPNVVYVGGVNTYYSTDGGANWQMIDQWYSGLPGVATVHADKHFLGFNPLQPSTLYETNDGGIYETLDPLSTLWTDLSNGLGITEFYRVAVDNTANFVIAGAQDNGTKSLMDDGTVADLTGGDGMECAFDYSDPFDIFFTAFQNGSIDITTDGGATYNSISQNIPGNPTGDWITPYVVHPRSSDTILAGYDTLWCSGDLGTTWFPISPTLGSASGKNINRISISARNPNYIWVVTDDNMIHCTTDFGTTWDTISCPYSANINDIMVDPRNENQLLVVLGGYDVVKVASYLKTTNTWVNASSGLPNVNMNCITIDSSTHTMYLGCMNGVFYRDSTMTHWALYNTHLPNVEVMDLGINYTTNELWAATFGRGLWKTQKADHTSEGLSVIPYAAGVINVFPNPSKGQFTISTSDKAFVGTAVTVTLIGRDGKQGLQQLATFDASGKIKMNVGALPKGIYICEVTNGSGAARTRVVIF